MITVYHCCLDIQKSDMSTKKYVDFVENFSHLKLDRKSVNAVLKILNNNLTTKLYIGYTLNDNVCIMKVFGCSKKPTEN